MYSISKYVSVNMNNEEIINKLYPSFQPLVRAFLDAAAKEGYNLRITDGYRSIAEQNALYAQGRTNPGAKVTNAIGGSSLHNFALAIDVVDTQKGYSIDWDRLGRIGESVGLEHGDRGFTDRPHFQYRGRLSLEAIQNGARPGNQLTEQDMKEIEELKETMQSVLSRLSAVEEKLIGEKKAKKIAIGVVKNRVQPKKLWKTVQGLLKK